jgi:signal transduction histidine kinase
MLRKLVKDLGCALGSAGRGFALFWLLEPQLVTLVMVLTSVGLIGAGVGIFLVPPSVLLLRKIATRRRARTAEWQGLEIPEPYRPLPDRRPGVVGHAEQTVALLTDPSTWRELLWILVDAVAGSFLALLPIGLIMEGVYGIFLTIGWRTVTSHGMNDWYTFVHVDQAHANLRWATSAIGVVLILAGLRVAKPMLAANARLTRFFLAPDAARLRARVEHLTTTRSHAVDAQAAEIRRIERDLHDGAQARLVAMGMNLSAASSLLDEDPEAARRLMLEARDSSLKALTEIRDLVRGIHPPVLADRGLADAVRALALDSPLDVEVTAEVPGRVAAPLESAAYFAVTEVLANAAKHAAASKVWIDLRHEDGRLRIAVGDDGVGGADPAAGTGLRGVERRLATFDGILALSSPPGGPTVVTMELPCASSSPKTSSSSGTA